MAGGAEPPDDPTIADDAVLWRRVPSARVVVEADGRLRPMSGAFERPADGSGMSVDLAEVVGEGGPEVTLRGFAGFGVLAVTARQCRDEKLGVVRSPLPDNPAHAEIVGPVPRAVARRLARQAKWVVPPSSPLGPPDGEG